MKGLRYMKKMWLFALASAVLLTGCASDQAKTGAGAGGEGIADTDSAPAFTEIAKENITIAESETQPAEKLTSPPDVMLSTTTEMIASAAVMTKGSYSWSYEENEGEMVSVIADCALPGEIKNVTAVFNPDELINVPQIILPSGAKIVKVQCWNGTETQDVDFDGKGNISIPEFPIGDTYCVTVEFDGTGFSYGEHGTCDYIFRTTDKEIHGRPSSDVRDENSVPHVTTQSSVGYNPDEAGQLPGLTVSDPIQYTPEPPELSMSVFTDNADTSVNLMKNTFMWTFIDGSGNEATVCVDCAAPYEMSLTPSFDVSEGAKARVELTEGGKLTGATNLSSEGEWLELDFQRTGEIYFPEQPIGEMYTVTVEYEQGTCVYVFAASYDKAEEIRIEALPVGSQAGEPVITPPCTFYRVHDFNDGREYPTVIVLDSVEALKQYYSYNSDGFELESVSDEMFGKYNREFFEENTLVFVRIMEGSGSISHTFKGIDADNNIIIERRIPEVGTDDMAYYHVAIEIPQDMAGNEFSLVTDTVYEGGMW